MLVTIEHFTADILNAMRDRRNDKRSSDGGATRNFSINSVRLALPEFDDERQKNEFN